MPKIKLTKNELKRQKEDLKRFNRYLPMLQLKKQQLQMEIIKIHRQIRDLAAKLDSLRAEVITWVDVFAQDFNWDEFLKVGRINTRTGNIAGIDIPLFTGISIEKKPYDLLLTPLWVDKAMAALGEIISLKAQVLILHRELDTLKEELRITTQRVNLFEKIKIPEARENIRIIHIYLGELQTQEVVRGKIAKAKLERVRSLS